MSNHSEYENDKAIDDMNGALDWIRTQLKYLKEQDKSLMKKFNRIREQINKLNEPDGCIDKGQSLVELHRIKENEFIEAQRCKLDPFDGEPDDGKSLRRRAFSSSALYMKSTMTTAAFAEVF